MGVVCARKAKGEFHSVNSVERELCGICQKIGE